MPVFVFCFEQVSTLALRLSIKVWALLFILLAESCNLSDNLTSKSKQSFNFNYNGIDYSVKEINISGNVNCNLLFTSVAIQEASIPGIELQFSLTKEGYINYVSFYDWKEDRRFQSALYNPTGNFSITNFRYSEEDQSFSFEFEGELLQEYPISISEKTFISGRANLSNQPLVDCFTDQRFVKANVNQEDFRFISSIGAKTEEVGTERTWTAFSDSGLSIKLIVSDKLNSFPIGTYEFDSTSLGNKLVIEQYEGSLTCIPSLATNWMSFKTIGSFSIDKNSIINGFDMVDGRYSFKSYNQNNQLVHEVTNGTFRLSGDF